MDRLALPIVSTRYFPIRSVDVQDVMISTYAIDKTTLIYFNFLFQEKQAEKYLLLQAN